MPLCIIVIWVVVSSGLANVDKEMKRKIMIVSVGFSVFCSLLVIHFKGMPYTWFVRADVQNDTELIITTVSMLSAESYPFTEAKKPGTHIAYIKTHKTGSSTIWSMLITFALNNNLTIAIPASKQGNKLGWPSSFTAADAVPPKPDLLCYHSRFSEAMLEYMPSDTVYLTSLRDPASQLKSAYEYFSASQCFNMSFEQFLNTANKTAEFMSQCNDYYKWWLMNGQLYDLGVSIPQLSSPHNKRKVLDSIAQLDKRFALVLILERLDESLIMMRDLLNWSTQDIIYFSKNFRLGDKEKVKYTELQQSLARQWNWADDLLYSHFLKKLETKLNKNPEYYKKEVKNLKHLTSLWMSRCVRKVIPAPLSDNKYMSTGYADNIGTYLLTSKGRLNNRCIQLTISEVSKVRLLNNGSAIDADIFKQGAIGNSGVRWR